MDAALRERHLERITDPRAVNVYDALCAACDGRDGGMTPADQMIVRDIAYAEQIKGLLTADIAERGVGRERSNGRQRYYEENKSLGQLRAYVEQQRKLLGELRLTPASRKAEAVSLEDDAFNDF